MDIVSIPSINIFQAAINEGNGLNKINAGLVAEKEEYIYRSYLSLGQSDIILNEIKDNHPKTTVGNFCLHIYLFMPTLFSTCIFTHQ